MDFWNRLSKKASETYRFTKEKAENLSEELKIKSKINELDGKIEKTYNSIGRIVYNEIKDGKDVVREEITAKCEDISRKKEEIYKLEDQLLAIKKAKKCISCGAAINITDEFCSKCGKEQPKQENVEIKEEPKNTKEAEVIEINDVDNTTNVSNENIENTNNENNNE